MSLGSRRCLVPESVLTVYAMGVVICLMGAIFVVAITWDRTWGARIIFLAPLWPLLAPIVLALGVRWLWREAEWGEWFRG